MADYVAILRKTIDGLESATPDVRKRVYEKARFSISNKIAAIQPPPPQAAIDKQMAILEKAISDVEAEYSLADIESSLRAPAPPVMKPVNGSLAEKAGFELKKTEPANRPELPGDRKSSIGAPTAGDRITPSASASKSKPGNSRLVPALLAGLALAGAGFAGYAYRADLARLAGGLTPGGGQTADTGEQNTADVSPQEPVVTPAETEPAPAETAPSSDTADIGAAGTDAPGADGATGGEAGGTPAEATPAEPKLTQRLLPDGTEVDEGAAGGTAASVGEGTSVAAATQPSDAEAPGDPAAGNPATAEGALAVGQKAIFYEERTSSTDGSALPGSVVWTAVTESPGNDLPPEPAIRAEITVPELEISLRMTLRRNADKTLPASHIIELVFSTPEGFAGGTIDQVQRITFKSTEQAPGNPLVALPAKIADGFFLVALNDASTALETNLTLLRREPWIDIPITYKTGRRALITMEKGIPGDKVFDEVLKVWEGAGTATTPPTAPPANNG